MKEIATFGGAANPRGIRDVEGVFGTVESPMDVPPCRKSVLDGRIGHSRLSGFIPSDPPGLPSGPVVHNRNLRREGNRHQNGTMRILSKRALAVCLLGLALCASWAQESGRSTTNPGKSAKGTNRSGAHNKERTLNSDDRLAVLASALDSKTPRRAERDCSHLVHAIYERAGFPYAYADSDDLYSGVEPFQRVSKPQSGDLVVWHGHTGIVIRPSRHVFFSFLHAGPGIDDYKSQYWASRGEPRFFRYLKNNPCVGCASVRSKSE